MTLEYLAGFFDGEGAVMIMRATKYKYRRPQFSLCVTANGVDPRPMEELCERFGGSVHLTRPRKATHSPCYGWVARHQLAARFLTELMPFLVVKKRDAEIGLAFQGVVRRGKGNCTRHGRKALSEGEIAERETLRLELIREHGFAARAIVQGGDQ